MNYGFFRFFHVTVLLSLSSEHDLSPAVPVEEAHEGNEL